MPEGWSYASLKDRKLSYQHVLQAVKYFRKPACEMNPHGSVPVLSINCIDRDDSFAGSCLQCVQLVGEHGFNKRARPDQ